jgi:hypothetical protein
VRRRAQKIERVRAGGRVSVKILREHAMRAQAAAEESREILGRVVEKLLPTITRLAEALDHAETDDRLTRAATAAEQARAEASVIRADGLPGLHSSIDALRQDVHDAIARCRENGDKPSGLTIGEQLPSARSPS